MVKKKWNAEVDEFKEEEQLLDVQTPCSE